MKRRQRRNAEKSRQPEAVAAPEVVFEKPVLFHVLGVVIPLVVATGIVNGLVRPLNPVPWHGYAFFLGFLVLALRYAWRTGEELRRRSLGDRWTLTVNGDRGL